MSALIGERGSQTVEGEARGRARPRGREVCFGEFLVSLHGSSIRRLRIGVLTERLQDQSDTELRRGQPLFCAVVRRFLSREFRVVLERSIEERLLFAEQSFFGLQPFQRVLRRHVIEGFAGPDACSDGPIAFCEKLRAGIFGGDTLRVVRSPQQRYCGKAYCQYQEQGDEQAGDARVPPRPAPAAFRGADGAGQHRLTARESGQVVGERGGRAIPPRRLLL